MESSVGVVVARHDAFENVVSKRLANSKLLEGKPRLRVAQWAAQREKLSGLIVFGRFGRVHLSTLFVCDHPSEQKKFECKSGAEVSSRLAAEMPKHRCREHTTRS